MQARCKATGLRMPATCAMRSTEDALDMFVTTTFRGRFYSQPRRVTLAACDSCTISPRGCDSNHRAGSSSLEAATWSSTNSTRGRGPLTSDPSALAFCDRTEATGRVFCPRSGPSEGLQPIKMRCYNGYHAGPAVDWTTFSPESDDEQCVLVEDKHRETRERFCNGQLCNCMMSGVHSWQLATPGVSTILRCRPTLRGIWNLETPRKSPLSSKFFNASLSTW